MELALQNASTYAELRGAGLRPWLLDVLAEVAPEAETCGVRFCGRRAMRDANRRYRARTGVTDVLSFPGEGHHLGDILVCVPRAAEQAVGAGHDTVREVRRLLLHGVLHCLGFDHEHDDGEMERVERALRRRWLGPR